MNKKDGDVAPSPLAQANNNPMAIKRLIAIEEVAYFAIPLTENKLAMRTCRNALEASITT